MRRHRKALRPVTEINLTSMLDVAFVLLIAFMLVAPQLKHGLDIDLPTVTEGAPTMQATGDPQVYTIVVPKPAPGATTPDIFMNDSPAALKDIEDRLKLQKNAGKNVAVEIQADRDVPYDTFVQVVAAVRRAGVEAVGLPVEAADVPRPDAKPDTKKDEAPDDKSAKLTTKEAAKAAEATQERRKDG